MKSFYLDSTVFSFAELDKGSIGRLANGIVADIPSFRAATSAQGVYEAVWIITKAAGRSPALDFGSRLLQSPVTILDMEQSVLSKAFEFVKKYRCNLRVGLHAACATLNGFNRVVSDDARFSKIPVVEALDFKAALNDLKK